MLNKTNKDKYFKKIYNNKKYIIKPEKQNTSETLQNDKNLSLESIYQDCNTLHYISDIMRKDEEVILELLKKDIKMIKFASYELRNDDIFLHKIENSQSKFFRSLTKRIQTEIRKDDEYLYNFI